MKKEYYPEWINEAAEFIAEIRLKNNKQVMKIKPETDRGDRNLEINRVGIQAELIAILVCERKGWSYDAAPIIRKEQTKRPDIILTKQDGTKIRIDVKALNSDYGRVNVEAHRSKEKSCDAYWFFRMFKENNRNCFNSFWFTYEQVNDWNRKEGAHGAPYLEKRIIEYSLNGDQS